jgi:predicted acylesterase/phospholipase RssA
MPYNIEVMSLGRDMYPELERAAKGLNGVQEQFRFEVTPEAKRKPGLAFRRQEYLSTDVWNFLKEQRAVGAPRPFIIAFVTEPLSSPAFSNLFGSHAGKDGLAVVTTAGTTQYVKEVEQYVRYFLVRYALSFVNWQIKAHEDEDRKDCYFHFKRHKPDLLASMNSGKICDRCMALLDNPPAGSPVHRLDLDERDALEKMRQLVAGAHPYSIVMKGGGIKGLALAGALIELEKHFWFDRHVGTSAGAIAAVLLAADFKPAELKELFFKKDFTDFLDAPWWKLPFNLAFSRGLYPGESFRVWIADLLTQKLNKMSVVRMEHLERAIIYATSAGLGTVTYDSKGPRRETGASYAVRCSMSIPVFFTPAMLDNHRVYDGGLRNNFPLKKFLETFGDAPFLALYLGKPNNRTNRWMISDFLDIVVDGEERELVDNHRKDVVVIDTSPIGTVNFRLTALEKEFLVAVGKAAALELLCERKIDGGPTEKEAEAARAEAERMRTTIVAQRATRRKNRNLLIGATVAVAVIVLAVGRLAPF